MVNIITNYGNNPKLKTRFLTTTLNFDAYRAASPILVANNDKTYIVARHLDRGNMEEYIKDADLIPADCMPVYYNPYFAFAPIFPTAHKDFMAAMEFVMGKETTMTVNPEIPISLYQTLSERFELVLEEKTPVDLKNAYKLPLQDVSARFTAGRKTAAGIALHLISASKDKEELRKYIENTEDTRFTVLNDLMKANNLDAVLCTSPVAVQEIAGLGLERHKDDEFAACYQAGSEFVYLFSAEPLNDFAGHECEEVFIPFIKSILDHGKLGIEEQHFSYNWVDQFNLKSEQLVNALQLIRQSREARGAYNLSYYIIASRASAYAIDHAAAWAKEQILSGNEITEMDISRKYDSLVKEFRENYKIPFRIEKYWTGLHASDRSITPSYPFDHRVGKNCKALKIDAGLMIRDEKGMHLGASDIARSFAFDENAQEMYGKLEAYMVKDLIPSYKDGIVVKDIYDAAAARIEKDRKRLEEIGMIPESYVGDVFRRDVGHVMGLQEPVSLWFDKGSEQIVREGMICAFEYQWSMQGYSIGVEDIFLIGKDHGINITRD